FFTMTLIPSLVRGSFVCAWSSDPMRKRKTGKQAFISGITSIRFEVSLILWIQGFHSQFAPCAVCKDFELCNGMDLPERPARMLYFIAVLLIPQDPSGNTNARTLLGERL